MHDRLAINTSSLLVHDVVLGSAGSAVLRIEQVVLAIYSTVAQP